MTGKSQARVVSVGTALVDIVLYVPSLPEPGGDVVAPTSRIGVGGAFNVMSAARRQDVSVTYAAGHGTGPFGNMVRSKLTQTGIGIAAPPMPSMDTGFCVAFVTADGERTFATAPGAEAIVTRQHLDALQVSSGDLVYVSGYGLAYPESGPVLAGWISELDSEVVVVVDPGPLVASIPEPVLRTVAHRSNWWSCNEREARLMTSAGSPPRAIRQLLRIAGRDGVLLRLGHRGCLLLQRGRKIQRIQGRAVQVRDTTGAGDIHTGTFMASLAQGLEPAAAVHVANLAAGIAVGRSGPPEPPTARELEEAMAGEVAPQPIQR